MPNKPVNDVVPNELMEVRFSAGASRLLAESGEEQAFRAYLRRYMQRLSVCKDSMWLGSYPLEAGAAIWIYTEAGHQVTLCFVADDL